jgi:hypothetical protein
MTCEHVVISGFSWYTVSHYEATGIQLFNKRTFIMKLSVSLLRHERRALNSVLSCFNSHVLIPFSQH